MTTCRREMRTGTAAHTASTAAGNANIPATVEGRDFGKISGVAPAAKLAVYKVCWEAGTGGCYNSDILDAIDDAIIDGVDVINFSISGSDAVVDATEFAFLSAASAGVFVSASAGNSGPGASTARSRRPVGDHGRGQHGRPVRGHRRARQWRPVRGHQHHRG